ncbi:MAG: hypothetical protein D6714_07895 [Bacteroidetes bacterium]|nr:MAG: hypothetical protein D6714_07895 [Bacteroidota bacterium]
MNIFQKMPIKYHYCLLIGTALGVFLGTRFYWYYLFWGETESFNWERYFASPFTNQVWWGVLVPLVYYCYEKFDWKTRRGGAILASIGVALFHEVTSYFVWGGFAGLLGMESLGIKDFPKIIRSVPTGFISQWIEYWIIWGLFALLDLSKKYHEKEMELARMENQLANARLDALRLQLQPHFLFNTLNTISSLMEFDVKDAQKIVSKFGTLLRTVLDEKKPALIPFRDEMTFIKSYLDIEQVRFSDRIKIVYDIDEKALEAYLPGLILQPLVENAVKHGFARHSNEGYIKLIARKCPGDLLELVVEDNGAGEQPADPETTTRGIGLKNVRDRLTLIYKDRFEMIIQTAPGAGFRVTLRLPFRWFPAEAGDQTA